MILTLKEKRGGKKRLEQDSAKFQELLDLHKLIEIENGNATFTSMNKRTGPQQISCRLDHFLLSETLLLEGPLIESTILPKRAHIIGLFNYGSTRRPPPSSNPSNSKFFGFQIQTSKPWQNNGGTQQRSSKEPRCTASSKISNTSRRKCESGKNMSLEIFFKKENSWNKNLNPFKRWPFKPDSPQISSRKRNK
jgi:hypothetical protein